MSDKAKKMGFDFSPEMIDGMVIQLDTAFQVAGDEIPENVKESGKKFLADLSEWSEAKKKAQQ